MKTSEKERVLNRAFRTRLRTAIKSVRAETTKDAAAKTFVAATVMIDRATSKGLIKKKTADRNKSRLALFVNKLS